MGWSRFRKKRDMPEGLWVKCPSCGETLFKQDLEANLHVCTACDHHFRISARDRLKALVDEGSFKEMWDDLYTIDRLSFVDKEPYGDKIKKAAKKVSSNEAAIAGVATIKGKPVSICILDFFFMGGSMGAVVGEKVTRAIEQGIDEDLPVILLSCSGGARMHEGMLSLMQMAKTSGALSRLDSKGGLCISVLTNPTTGGVMASFAALGDLIFAEPQALIGFAGPRVIAETLRTELPEGFQTSEFLLERGFIDAIIARKDLPEQISTAIGLLRTYTPEQLELYAPPAPPEPEETVDIEAAEAETVEAEQGSPPEAS